MIWSGVIHVACTAEKQKGGTQQESSAADGNVTDVDFEEVKEEKK